tara:strand:+ start:590 stop:769 length:180 start_codon:yes stop_codon:yes gene_type:complete
MINPTIEYKDWDKKRHDHWPEAQHHYYFSLRDEDLVAKWNSDDNHAVVDPDDQTARFLT